MNIPTGWVAIASGLVGALITAVLNYYVRLFVARRAQADVESRIVFVHLVRVSEVVATEQVLTTYVDAIKKALATQLTAIPTETGKYELSHRICAEIARGLTSIPDDKRAEIRRFGYLAEPLERMASSFSEYKLSLEQLSRLPKDVVIAYSAFNAHAGHLHNAVLTWTNFLRSGDSRILTAEVIHGQWISLQAFLQAARTLRTGLIDFGRIDAKEANAVLTKQYEITARTVQLTLNHQAKVKAALEAAIKAAAREADKQPTSPDAAK